MGVAPRESRTLPITGYDGNESAPPINFTTALRPYPTPPCPIRPLPTSPGPTRPHQAPPDPNIQTSQHHSMWLRNLSLLTTMLLLYIPIYLNHSTTPYGDRMYGVQCTLYNVQCTMYDVRHTIGIGSRSSHSPHPKPHCTWPSCSYLHTNACSCEVYSEVYSVQCTVYSVQVYSVQLYIWKKIMYLSNFEYKIKEC